MTLDHLTVVLAIAVTVSSATLSLLLRDRRREGAREWANRPAMRPGNPVPGGGVDWSKAKIIPRGAAAPAPLDDMLVRFLADRTIAAPDARVQSSALYEAFEGWCQQNGGRCWSQKGFSKAMSASGFDKTFGNGVWWQGLRLIDAAPTDEVA